LHPAGRHGVSLAIDEKPVLSGQPWILGRRTASKTSPRCHGTWNLSNGITASGAWVFVEVKNAFHVSIMPNSIPWLFAGPSTW